jgi:hypothetical protein
VFKWPNLFSEPTSLSLFETYASTGRKGMWKDSWTPCAAKFPMADDTSSPHLHGQ